MVNQDLVVIDGHNRLRVCQKHGIPYRMMVFEFDDLLEAKQWALEAQKARRNLDKWELGKIALKLKPEVAARAKANMSIGGSKKKSHPKQETDGGQSGHPVQDPTVERIIALEQEPAGEQEGFRVPTPLVAEKVNTRQKLAEAVGLSADMMGKIIKIDESAPAAVREALDRKEMSINQAYSVTRYLQQFPESEREKQVEIAMELAKSREELRKGDKETESRAKTAGLFTKAFASCVHLKPTVENVACWVDCTRMTRLAIQNSIDAAKDYAEVFTAVAEVLQQLLEAGVGADSMTVLSRNRDAGQMPQNNNKEKEEDKSA